MNLREPEPAIDRAVRAATRILVAAGAEDTRALLRGVVEERGYTVELAGDGAGAWQAYERERPALVLVDWRLPTMDGLEVCRRIRAADPSRQTFVLLLIGHDSDADLERALDAGADDYLSKPFSADELRARLAIAERRIALEEQRRAAESELARGRWLTGVGETTMAVEHEINNPLAALLGYASLLELSQTLSDADRRHVMVVTEQARRIASVVKRLSTLKNPQSVHYIHGARMIDLSDRNANDEDTGE